LCGHKRSCCSKILEIAVILSAALVVSIEMKQTIALAIDTGKIMMDNDTGRIMICQIANVQLGNDSKPAWIQSGI
jgi:hypothetical protein